MSLVILLDAGPVGLITNPTASPTNDRCSKWLERLLDGGFRVVLPEIASYVVRRKLLPAGKMRGLANLDRLKRLAEYATLTTETMPQAAEFWAGAHRRGRSTTDAHALDGDVILAAQAAIVARAGDRPVIAAANAAHLPLLADARPWQDIP